jgi:hypothetical protein
VFFFIHRLDSRKDLSESEEKSAELSFKKIGDDVIAQKPMTPFKQIACQKMAFCK